MLKFISAFLLLFSTAYAQVSISRIPFKDSFDFTNSHMQPLPEQSIYDGKYVFGYTDRSYYYIKALNENELQYAIVKCGTDNKQLLSMDISAWVQNIGQRVVDSGLCKSWHHCYRFSLRSYPDFLILDIYYSGEKPDHAPLNKVIVFDPQLKVKSSADDITPDYYIATNHLSVVLDGLYLDEVKGKELVSYKTSLPTPTYIAKENEQFFCDRPMKIFYRGITNHDTLSIFNLSDPTHPVITISGLVKSANLFFIDITDYLFTIMEPSIL